jgi:carboxylesterase type B
MMNIARCFCVLPAALALSAMAFAAPVPGAVRTTALGEVVGVDDSATSGTWAWKGIPYAQAPVGDLRWKAPLDARPWTAPRAAMEFGAACASTGRFDGPGLNNRYDQTLAASLGKTVGSEDCLFLNVWRPATNDGKLPVIVFVHGGSNVSGYTADPMYEGATLARTANAVVVTVNYRLGVFGFFRSSQLRSADAAESSGNFALLDLIKSLQFVQRNIEAFGGDAGNVTLMGESAGAVNVYALMTSPLMVSMQPGLVHRVLPMSGGISRAQDLPPGSVPVLLDPGYFDRQAELLSNGVRDVRSLSTDEVLSLVRTKLTAANLAQSGPIADGVVMSRDPIGAIRAGHYLKVPVLAGNTRDEAKLFSSLLALPALGGVSGRQLGDTEMFDLVSRYDPDAPAQIRIDQWIPAAYLPVDTPRTGYNARTRLLNEVWFSPLRDSVLDALKSRQDTVWHYRFDWAREPAPFDAIYGAAHAFDLFFTFGNFGPSVLSRVLFSKASQPGRLALSDAMMRSIGAFARSGNPNNAALGTAWPAWPRSLLFDASLEAKRISVSP